MNAITIVCIVAENAENICTPSDNISTLFTQLFWGFRFYVHGLGKDGVGERVFADDYTHT
jgi:hypothetical protein